LKTKINGVQVDILYAYLPIVFTQLTAKAAVNALDELTLRKMDEQSLLSLNGNITIIPFLLCLLTYVCMCSVGHKDSELLLKVIPDLGKFRLLLRFVKLWSTRTEISARTYSLSLTLTFG